MQEKLLRNHTENIICLSGAKKETSNGNRPPAMNEQADANAACKGLTCVISLMPNSSLACAAKASCSVSWTATSRASSCVNPLFS